MIHAGFPLPKRTNTFARCAASFCRTSLDLDWSAWVCEHDVVTCGPDHALDACPECAEGSSL